MSDELLRKKVRPHQPINGDFYHPVVHAIVNHVNKGLAPIIVICGEMGLGKSMGAAELARILHNEINLMKGEINEETIQEQLLYEVIPFLDIVVNTRRKVLIFDEAGVRLNSKDWYSDFNRSVDDVLQTMRKQNHVYIFVAPRVKDMDKAIRKFMNGRLLAVSEGAFQFTWVKSKHEKIADAGKDYQKFRFNELFTPELPPDAIQDAYRDKEEDFKDSNVKDRLEELREKQKKEEREDKVMDASQLL